MTARLTTGPAATDGGPIAAARAIGDVLRDHADEGERARRLPAATAGALAEAGMLRLCRARELGGLEADPLTVVSVVEELARHDGSAAWCALNCGIAGVLQSFLPPEGADEIGDAPDVVLNGVIAPSGRAVEVDGGYRVTGRWSFATNCHHCTWLALSCVVVRDGGTTEIGTPATETGATATDEPPIMVLVPAPQWRIVETWDTVGLRATGSHDVEISDVFVPAHRCVSMVSIVGAEPVLDRPISRFPLVGLFSLGMAACALGVAKAAIDELVRLAGARTPFGMSTTLATRAGTQTSLCEATATAGSASALLEHEAGRVWQRVQAGEATTPDRRAPLRIAAVHAARAAAAATDLAYTAAGSAAIFESSPLQRCLRDVRTLTQHVFVAPPTYEVAGKVLLGVEADASLL